MCSHTLTPSVSRISRDYYFFWPSVDMIPSTEHLWNRKLVSLTSPLCSEIFLPRSHRSWRADVLSMPSVSMAIGSKIYRPSRSVYFSSLWEGEISATAPDSSGCTDIWVSQWTCYCDIPAQRFPLDQETSVRPSGRLPSDLNKPEGSLVTGKPAHEKAQVIRSLKAWCLEVLPGALLHTKLWTPRTSTLEPQWHLCGTHRFKPSLTPTATLTALSSSFKPHEAIGREKSQSPLRWWQAARKKARLWGEFSEASTSAFSANNYYYYYYSDV